VTNDSLRTYTCLGCGAALATSASPGSTLNCPYCGTEFRVPLRQPDVSQADTEPLGEPQPGQAAATEPARPWPTYPESPGIEVPSLDVAAAAAAHSGAGAPAGTSGAPHPPAAAPEPVVVASEGSGTVAQLDEPGAAGGRLAPEAPPIPPAPDPGLEPIVVPPDRVRVIPAGETIHGRAPQPPRSRLPLLAAAGFVACCLLPLGLGMLCALTGLLTR
jgi:DNA-directed RNA polymerase subunit RPC12/RpoP